MPDFTYTHVYDIDSSWLNKVYFNQNVGYAVVETKTELLYEYHGVDPEDVRELAEQGGAYYNTVFKKDYGPSNFLGDVHNVSFEAENVHAVRNDFAGSLVQNDWVPSWAKETPVVEPLADWERDLLEGSDVPDGQDADAPAEDVTREFSLVTPELVVDPTFAVDFTVGNDETVRTHRVQAVDIVAAVLAVWEIAEMLDLEFHVVKVERV